MRTERRIDVLLGRRRGRLGECHTAATADAVTERAQPVGGSRAVPDEAAAFAPGRRLGMLVQRSFNVPSLCSRAFEVFWAAGSDELSVAPGASAYGYVLPPPSGKT